MVGWAGAVARRPIAEWGGKWRAEVGPRLPGGRPRRLLRYPIFAKLSFERLIFTEIGNRHTQRIDGDQLVGHAGLETEYKIAGIEVALQFAVIGGRGKDEIKNTPAPGGG